MGGLLRGAAALCAVEALLAVPAGAEERSRVAIVGGLTVTWRADAARGCEAAGLCGYSGSLTWRPGSRAELALPTARFPPFLFLQSDEPATVRVRREEGGTCVDAVPTESADLNTKPLGGGRYAIPVPVALSSGRCAGPSVADLLPALPVTTIDVGALRRGVGRAAWAGGPLAVGPWVGEVSSTLAARLARLRGQPRPTTATSRPRIPARLRGRTVYRTTVEYAYRVTRVVGALDIGFHGSPVGGCAPVDACGTTGALALTPGSAGRLEIGGEREALTPHPRVSLDGYGELRVTGGRTTEVLQRPSAPDCTDAQRPDGMPLGGGEHKGAVRITLGSPNTLTADVLRTRCPGPAQADVFGRGVMAAGDVPRSALGRRHLRVALRATGSFAAGGFAGTRAGTVTLDLERVRARVHHSQRTL